MAQATTKVLGAIKPKETAERVKEWLTVTFW